MSPSLSHSCKEKLPKLLNKTCKQSIRPKTDRIKVGDRLIHYNHQRSKKNCKNCLSDCIHNQYTNDMPSCIMGYCKGDSGPIFNNVIGYSRVTEVFDVDFFTDESALKEGCELTFEIKMNNPPFHRYGMIQDLAKRDGFETVWDFIKWFNTHYSLETPQKFTCIRWDWIEEDEYASL